MPGLKTNCRTFFEYLQRAINLITALPWIFIKYLVILAFIPDRYCMKQAFNCIQHYKIGNNYEINKALIISNATELV